MQHPSERASFGRVLSYRGEPAVRNFFVRRVCCTIPVTVWRDRRVLEERKRYVSINL